MVYGRAKIGQLAEPARSRFLSAEPDLLGLGFDVYITETLRGILVQIAYFAQGRVSLDELNEIRSAAGLSKLSGRGQIVTNADGIVNRSKHQDGLAIDVVPFDANRGVLLWNAAEGVWLDLGAIAKRHGFEWGGDWKTHPAARLGWDCPHWEIQGG